MKKIALLLLAIGLATPSFGQSNSVPSQRPYTTSFLPTDAFLTTTGLAAATPSTRQLTLANAQALAGWVPPSNYAATSAIPAANITGTVTNVTVPALGGTNDDTGIFNTYFNSHLPVVCPVGDFNVSRILITNDNETISGYGCRLHMLTNTTGYAFCTRGMTNISLAGLAVYGGIHQSPGWTATNQVPAGIATYDWATIPSGSHANATPTNANSGFYCAMFGWSKYKDLVADGFSVAGFYLSNTNTQYSHSTPIALFEGNHADWCYQGICLAGNLHVMDFTTNNTYVYFDASGQIPGYGDAQYSFINSPIVHNCSIGISCSSWNCSVENPQISDCWIGGFLSGNLHGEITGGSLNHNSGVSYYMEGISAGQVISGQQLRGGDGLYISQGCAGVSFNGCMFDASSVLVVTNNTGATVFNNCSWSDAFTFTLDNSGIGVVTNGCYNEVTLTNQSQMSWVGNLKVPTNAVCPAPIPGVATIWNSNGASYWVTTAHTNYVTGP